MKTIVIDARIINSSTGRYVERLVTYLQDIDTKNHYIVLVPTKDRDYWKPKNKNFEVRTVDYKNYSFSEQFGFLRYLNGLHADLVHFCMPQQPLFYRGKHVTTIHDLTLLHTYNSDKNWLSYHLKQLVGRIVFYKVGHVSDELIAISDYTGQDFSRFAHIDDEKITVTLEAADKLAAKSNPYPDIGTRDQFLLYVGQQSDYKNIKRLIEAHQGLLLTHPKLKLVLVGSLNAAATRNKVWAEGNDYKNVVFTGFVPDEQLAWLYEHCRVYVFPSLMEGFGLPGLEAMIHGAPVVCSNATSLPEVYGDAAVYFNPKSVAGMVQAISAVLTDDELRSSLITKGSKQAKKYSWRRMAEQTHEVYLRALRKS